MEVHYQRYVNNNIAGMIISMAKAGSGLPMHSHKDSETGHNIIVLQGSICVYGENASWIKVLKHGEIFDFDSDEPHEICALEDSTKILNLYLIKPIGFDEDTKMVPYEIADL